MQAVRFEVETAALTRSERGSVVVHRDAVHILDAAPAVRVIDTTGAGDLYAAGFLHGYTRGLDAATCGREGGICAARSDERRGGQECVSTCRSRGEMYN